MSRLNAAENDTALGDVVSKGGWGFFGDDAEMDLHPVFLLAVGGGAGDEYQIIILADLRHGYTEVSFHYVLDAEGSAQFFAAQGLHGKIAVELHFPLAPQV